MTRKEITTYSILSLLSIAGIWAGGFWGGVATGTGTLLILLATVGKWQANLAARQIDKNIQDTLTSFKQKLQDEEDGL